MGESVVERPTIESKMGGSAATLEVSVSFGKFENDSLSWEKWSSFSPNKYLEEVEKCSTPGSVAQKKAYFEAHYKKIAALKAEKSEQEKPMESLKPSSVEPEQKMDLVKTECSSNNGEIHLFSNDRSAQDVMPDFRLADGINITTSEEEKVDNEISVNSQDLIIEETKEEINGTLTNLNSSAEEERIEETKEELNYASTIPESSAKEELIGSLADPKSSVREESTEVLEKSAKESCPEIKEQSFKVDETKKAVVDRSKSPKLSARYNAQKVTPHKKEQTSAGERKKVASPAIRSSSAASPVIKSSSPAAKLSHYSTPRLSKSTMMPASQSSTKKVNGSSFPKSKITRGEYRKPGPTSLHMSLSLDHANSGASFTTPRKSLIMERMGDKDIVRRAFKTFQNSINGLRSSTDGLFSGPQQVSYKVSEQKVPNTLTPQKENEGRRKTTEKINQSGFSGNRSNLVSTGLHKGPGTDKKYVATVSTASLRSDARTEKQKEDKSKMRVADKTELGAKKKVEKEAQLKNVRQGINSKASPFPASNRGKVMSKIPPETEDKSKIHNQPTSKR